MWGDSICRCSDNGGGIRVRCRDWSFCNKDGPEVGSKSGRIDVPWGLRAFKRANGEYLVFVEEDLRAKVIMYRLAV